MESEEDAPRIVHDLVKEDEEDDSNAGHEENVAPVEPSGRPSVDAQNFEVVQPEPQIVEEIPSNDEGGGGLIVVEETAPPTRRDPSPQITEPESTPTTRQQTPPSRPSSRSSDVQTSLIQVQLQVDASMDNDELEAVRQTMTFILGFYRKWHEEHYHRNKPLFEFGKAHNIAEIPKTDDCLPEFHAKVEGVATSYASRLAQTALQIEPSLLAKAAAVFQKFSVGGGDRSEADIWTAFREQSDSLFKSGESWEKFVVILLLAYLVCLSDEVRTRQRATGFLRSFIQYLVAERHIRWVARHGGWANAAWGLRRQRLARCLCARSTMYGFILITIGVAAVGIFLTKKQRH